MSDKSAIEWTDATWNPTTGSDPGIAGLRRTRYALNLAARLKHMGSAAYQVDGDPQTSGPGFKKTAFVRSASRSRSAGPAPAACARAVLDKRPKPA